MSSNNPDNSSKRSVSVDEMKKQIGSEQPSKNNPPVDDSIDATVDDSEQSSEQLPTAERIKEVRQALREVQANTDRFSRKSMSIIILAMLQRIVELQTFTDGDTASIPKPATTERRKSIEREIDTASSGYLDIVQFFRIILVNIWIILIIGVIGTGISYVVINAQTPIYETEASLAILPNFDEDAIPRPIDNINLALGTYVQTLRSSNLNDAVDEAIKTEFDNGLVNRVEINITPIENSSIIIITVRSESPELAQAYANEIVNQITTANPLPLFEVSYRVVVLDNAQLPNEPAFPDLELGLVFGAAGSLTVGLMVAFLVDAFVRMRRRNATGDNTD